MEKKSKYLEKLRVWTRGWNDLGLLDKNLQSSINSLKTKNFTIKW